MDYYRCSLFLATFKAKEHCGQTFEKFLNICLSNTCLLCAVQTVIFKRQLYHGPMLKSFISYKCFPSLRAQ